VRCSMDGIDLVDDHLIEHPKCGASAPTKYSKRGEDHRVGTPRHRGDVSGLGVRGADLPYIGLNAWQARNPRSTASSPCATTT